MVLGMFRNNCTCSILIGSGSPVLHSESNLQDQDKTFWLEDKESNSVNLEAQ